MGIKSPEEFEKFCQFFDASSQSNDFHINNFTQSLLQNTDYFNDTSSNEDIILEACNRFQNNNFKVYQIKFTIVKYVYPFLISFGLFVNFLSFVAMMKKFRREKVSQQFKNRGISKLNLFFKFDQNIFNFIY
jgi:hypothetical protein